MRAQPAFCGGLRCLPGGLGGSELPQSRSRRYSSGAHEDVFRKARRDRAPLVRGDAEAKTLGRLATQIADVLRGKRKPAYTPHVDTGDFVIVVNAEKVHVTGQKLDQKLYYNHSGYPGGQKADAGEQLRAAGRGNPPPGRQGDDAKNRPAAAQLPKLKIYAGPDHPHAAQNPEPFQERS